MTTSTILDRLGRSYATSYTGIEMIIVGSTAEACKSTLDLPVRRQSSTCNAPTRPRRRCPGYNRVRSRPGVVGGATQHDRRCVGENLVARQVTGGLSYIRVADRRFGGRHVLDFIL